MSSGAVQAFRSAILVATLFAGAAVPCAAAQVSDLTIEVGGDLLKQGGVVTVYPIPVPAVEWSAASGGRDAGTIRLDGRYAQVQLRYPADGTFTYRFRPVAGTPNPEAHGTYVLSIIGTDEQERGPQMTAGFAAAYSSGGRIIRVPSLAELAGPDEATRTNARWGRTEGYDAVPPADERSARALLSVVDDGSGRVPLACAGDARAQICTVPASQWPKVEAQWWRAIAEGRLERLDFHALRRCYDSTWLGGGACDAIPDSDEPDYRHRP